VGVDLSSAEDWCFLVGVEELEDPLGRGEARLSMFIWLAIWVIAL